MPQTIDLSESFTKDLANWDAAKAKSELSERHGKLHILLDEAEKAKRELSNEETNKVEQLDAECAAINDAFAADWQRERLSPAEVRERLAEQAKNLAPGRRLSSGSGRPVENANKRRREPRLSYVRNREGRLEVHVPEGYGLSDGGFDDLGEQLLAVHERARPNYLSMPGVDDLLGKLQQLAPAGSHTNTDSEGGHLVQKDFSATIFKRMYELGQVLSRVNRVGVSGNGLKMPVVAESSRATGSRYGGVQVYRVGEGNSGTYTRPKLAMIELTLKKLMGLYVATDELLSDASAMAQLAQQAISEEFVFKIENEIFRGTGAGEMLGILNSPCLVTVGEGAASTDEIIAENVKAMWARLWARSRQNAVWFINQDCLPSLMSMNQAVGTAGGELVYLPPGGLSAAPYGTLFGRPVIEVEYAATVGDVADICLFDMSQYLMIEKGGMTSDSSIHVYFDSAQTAFRWTIRNDGQPLWHSALTPFQGSNTVSPFVVAATRT